MRLRLSLAGRVAIALVTTAVVVLVVTVVLDRWLPPWLAALTAFVLVLPTAIWLGGVMTRPWSNVVQALTDGVASLRDHDFSVSISPPRDRQLNELVTAYNSLGDLLRRERLDLYQRELLLDTVIQTTPLALVLTNAAGHIVFSNIAARQLLSGGRKLEGFSLVDVLQAAPEPLREAVAAEHDTLFTMKLAGEAEVFH